MRLRAGCAAHAERSIVTGRANLDPSADLRDALTAPTVNHRATIIDPSGIGSLLRAIDCYDGHFATKIALQRLALTFVRPGEARYAEWSEFDPTAAEWRISAGKMKMRRPQRIPLSKQAVALLGQLRPVTGTGRWLFPSIRSLSRPISENTLTQPYAGLVTARTTCVPMVFARSHLHASTRWDDGRRTPSSDNWPM